MGSSDWDIPDGIDAGYRRAWSLYTSGDFAEAFAAYNALAVQDPDNGALLSFIARMHFMGLGTEKDENEALRWYNSAVEAGYMPAALYLSNAYSRKDRLREAREALEKAAARGYSPALYFLGRLYEVGRGVPRDEETAYAYFREAAAKGHLFAQRQLAVALIKGKSGFFLIPLGVAKLIHLGWLAFKLQLKDPLNERIRV